MGAHIGVVFYVRVGIFNVFVIPQFCAFANDIYSEGAGRRLFPTIAVGQSLGAVAGASSADGLFHNLKSPYEVMLLDAILLLLSVAIIFFMVDRWAIR